MIRIALFTSLALASGCATTSPSAKSDPRLACLTPAARNPPAHLARDLTGVAGGPAARNPSPLVVRGLIADDDRAGPVGDPAYPALARGNPSQPCTLTLAAR